LAQGTHIPKFAASWQGGGSYNLITMLMNSIAIVGGLSKGDLISKLVSFGANGVLVFKD